MGFVTGGVVRGSGADHAAIFFLVRWGVFTTLPERTSSNELVTKFSKSERRIRRRLPLSRADNFPLQTAVRRAQSVMLEYCAACFNVSANGTTSRMAAGETFFVFLDTAHHSFEIQNGALF